MLRQNENDDVKDETPLSETGTQIDEQKMTKIKKNKK